MEVHRITDCSIRLHLTLPRQALVCTCLQYKSFENNVGKEEIARNEQFLLFPQCFLTHSERFLPFSSNLKLSSANFQFGPVQNLSFGKGLSLFQTTNFGLFHTEKVHR